MTPPKPKQNRGNRPKPTAQQARAVALFKENILSGGTKSYEAILVEAGYSPGTARQQTLIMAGIRPHLDPFITRMEALRERVIGRMEEKVDYADFPDATRALHTLTHNIRLLS